MGLWIRCSRSSFCLNQESSLIPFLMNCTTVYPFAKPRNQSHHTRGPLGPIHHYIQVIPTLPCFSLPQPQGSLISCLGCCYNSGGII